MAKLTFSVLLSDASGKAGDVVFSRWKGRAYARRRVTPANPNTSDQQAQRNALALCVGSWQSLITKIKTSWSNAGSANQISGYNQFMKENVADERAGNWEALTSQALSREPLDSLSAIPGANAGEIQLSWSAGEAEATDVLTIAHRKQEESAVTVDDDSVTTVATGNYTITGLDSGTTYVLYAAPRDAEDNYAPSVATTATAT